MLPYVRAHYRTDSGRLILDWDINPVLIPIHATQTYVSYLTVASSSFANFLHAFA